MLVHGCGRCCRWFPFQGRQPQRDSCGHPGGIVHGPERGGHAVPQRRQGFDHGAQHHQVCHTLRETHCCAAAAAAVVVAVVVYCIVSLGWHCLVSSCLISSYRVFARLILSYLVLSCLFPSYLVLSYLVLSCLILSCLVMSCPVLSCLVLSCLVLSCLAALMLVPGLESSPADAICAIVIVVVLDAQRRCGDAFAGVGVVML